MERAVEGGRGHQYIAASFLGSIEIHSVILIIRY